MSEDNKYDRPGSGVAFWQPKDQRRSEMSPDFKGYVVLEMDYKAGEKFKVAMWSRKTKTGAPYLTMKEDNYTKKQFTKPERGDVEVEHKPRQSKKDSWDEDVPF